MINSPAVDTKQYAIEVKVNVAYLDAQSSPEDGEYAYAYTVTIKNVGLISAQLISRHWMITNERQEVQEVKGLGVIGEQPLLEPGQEFTYTSGTVLRTPTGDMHGSYQMVATDGTWFEAKIPPFSLHQTKVLH